MMRLQAYAGISLIATLAVVCYAFISRGQFYPAMVYLSTSKISLGLLFNMGMVIMFILWQLTKRIFLGSLREAEVERLNEQSWREVMEILFAITVFRQDFSVSLLAMVTALLFIKALHWLAQKRVEYIETSPTVPGLCHVRIVSFMGFLLVIDGLFLFNYVEYLVKTRQASVSIFFSFQALVVPHEDVTRTVGSQTNVQQGTNVESASQGSQADCIGFDSVNQHRARIQAAATAASVYEKSFVYPSEGMQLRQFSGPIHNPLESSVSVNSGQGQSQLNQFRATDGSQFPCYAFAPSQRRSSNLHRGENSNNYNWDSQLDAHKKLMEQHIEILQCHLMLLKKLNTERAVDNPGASSGKAKAV
nr:ERAD-associated E3 ubiquitin-protein ligase HRD1B-like [Ipomoea batatas]